MSIRNKLIIFIVGMCLFSTSFMIIGSMWIDRKFHEEDLNKRFHVTQNFVELSIKRHFENIEASLETVIQNKELTREVLVALSALHPKRNNFYKFFMTLAEVARQHQIIQWKVYFKSFNNTEYQLFGAYDHERIFSFFTKPGENNQEMVQLIVDQYGFIYPDLAPSRISSLSIPSRFTGVEADYDLVIHKGKFYLCMNFPLINQTLGDSVNRQGRFIYIGQSYGVLKLFQELSTEWLSNLEKEADIFLDIYLENGVKALGGHLRHIGQEHLRQADHFEYKEGQKAYIAKATVLELKRGLRAVLVMSTPKSVEQRQLMESSLLLVGIGILTLFFAVPTVSLIIYYFVRPIINLNEGAERIAKGDLAYPVAIKGKDELGNLARSFWRMRNAIRDKIEELNREILTRKQTESYLCLAEERYRRIFEEAIEGIFQYTQGGALVRLNPSGAKMLGYKTPKEAMLTVKDVRQEFFEYKDYQVIEKRIASNGHIKAHEVRWKKREGSFFWIVLSARIVKDEKGNLYTLKVPPSILQSARRRKARWWKERRPKLRIGLKVNSWPV